MRMARSLFLAPLLCLSLPAQGTEWVTNGSFTGTLSPWVMGGGFSVNPGLQTGWDTTGLGASDSFGCSPGGQAAPGPYPPNTLEQSIIVVSSLTYEFRCDASANGGALSSAVDLTTIYAQVNGVEVARFAFTTGGAVKDVVGPTFWINSNRRVGTTVQCAVRGDANATYATFIAANERNPGLPLPGINGLLMLDSTATMMTLATLDNTGAGSSSLVVPNLPFLLSTPFWYQAGMVSGSTVSLGYDFGVVFVQ